MQFSLKKKTILLIAAIGLLIGVIAVFIYNNGIRNIIKIQYERQSIDIARTVAVEMELDRLLRLKQAVLEIYDSVDDKVLSDKWGTPEFDAYIAHYADIEESEDFLALRDHLRRIQDVNHVDCLYLTWLDVEHECVVYLVDGAYEDACPPGCIDPIYGDFSDTLKNPGLGMAPNITNMPEYGWIVATDMPVFDGEGEVVAYAAVDISMNDIVNTERRFLAIVAGILLLVTVIVCLLGIFLVNRVIIRPINALSEAASKYTTSNFRFSSLKIKRGDEIGVLADSMVRMERDLDEYIANLTKTQNELVSAREHAERMDLAANIDALTKVRNKRAYDIDVIRLGIGSSEYGLIVIDLNGLKAINDSYGHEKGDVAIKMLCQIVCRVFKHSPVYRIGGDEFTVILENDDYRDRDALMEQFRSEIGFKSSDESLPPWERVSAASGMAIFEPDEDGHADGVFNRADKAMYENKRAMKAARR